MYACVDMYERGRVERVRKGERGGGREERSEMNKEPGESRSNIGKK